ncbi:Rox3-domain-containing protein [Wilcoxina mikolae CBS 423.85]|nr:Rox3-domain-containing protein [Wilcoxina mikolae CBS 423.85]
MSTPPSSFGSRTIQTTITAPTSQLTPSSSGAPNSATEDIEMEDSFGESNPHSNKRRRTYGSFDAERRSVPPNLRHIGNSTDGGVVSASPSMQQIQELISNPDCSPYHLVCQKPHERSYPDPKENLLQLYGLQAIAERVARFDATGKKNKLRKSYKGHISGISGKNEVVAKPTQLGHPMEDRIDPVENKLQHLAYYPAEEWHLSNVLGKELHNGFDMAKLKRGLAGITKGDIPGFDASILGLDDELPRKRLENARSPPMTVGTPQLNGSTPGNASTISGGANGDDLRPKRQKKRRRYDEGSYEGYEGYDDEDAGTNAGNGPGGGNWDGDQNKKKKKRKKA